MRRKRQTMGAVSLIVGNTLYCSTCTWYLVLQYEVPGRSTVLCYWRVCVCIRLSSQASFGSMVHILTLVCVCDDQGPSIIGCLSCLLCVVMFDLGYRYHVLVLVLQDKIKNSAQHNRGHFAQNQKYNVLTSVVLAAVWLYCFGLLKGTTTEVARGNPQGSRIKDQGSRIKNPASTLTQ
jgi:hypothetical protein